MPYYLTQVTLLNRVGTEAVFVPVRSSSQMRPSGFERLVGHSDSISARVVLAIHAYRKQWSRRNGFVILTLLKPRPCMERSTIRATIRQESKWGIGELRARTGEDPCTFMPRLIPMCPGRNLATGLLKSAGPSWRPNRLDSVLAMTRSPRSELSKHS